MDMNIQPEALGALFEMSRDAVLGIGSDGIIVFANPAASALLGVWTGRPAAEIIPDYILGEPADRFVASAQIGKKSADVSVVRLGGITLLNYTLPDTASAAHAPLSEKAIRDMSGYLQNLRSAIDLVILRIGADNSPATQKYVSALNHEYYLLRRLCQHLSLANYIRHGALPLQTGLTDLDTLCGDLCATVDHFSEDTGVRVRFHADNAPHLTVADADKLEIMLLTLIANSLARSKAGSVIDLALSRRGENLVFTVNDSGSGIALERYPDYLTGMAIPDMTDTAAGAGLGLLIARGIAEQHGGSFLIANGKDHGTTISITLPCRQPDTTEFKSPMAEYRSDGMTNVLTELSVILDKKYYNSKMLD